MPTGKIKTPSPFLTLCMITSLSLHFSYSYQFFLSFWCLICGPFHLHLHVCYCPDASTFISSLSLHLPSIKFIFSLLLFLCFLFSVYSILSSFYSCNYLLGHYNKQVLLLCTFTMYIDLIKELYKHVVVSFFIW